MLFGAIQGFILVLILIFKKTIKKTRLYLSIILFALSMNLLYYFFSLGGAAKMLPVIDLVYIPWSLLAAVSFYLYIAFISPFQKKLTLLNKLGFVPFLLFSIVIGMTKWYNFLSLPEQQINNDYISLLGIIEEYFALLFSLFMGYLAYGRLNKMEVELQKKFSNYNKSKLVFHKRFVLIVFLFCVIWFVAITYCQIYNITSLSLYFSIWLFMAFVIHWIAWTGFINDDALLPDFENNFTFDVIKTEEKYQSKEKIFFDANNEYYRSLVLLFEEERFF